MNQDLMELYENNLDFKVYVDLCCANNGYHKTATLQEVLSRSLTKEVADMYSSNAENQNNQVING